MSNKNNLFKYVYQLPQATQDSIKSELTNLNLEPQEIEIALNSRLCDLEETIDINKYI